MDICIKKLYKSYQLTKFKKYNFYKDNYYQDYITKEEKQLVKKGIYNNYEEMPFNTVKKILNTIETTKDDIFYDLGSGIGKFCIQVNLSTLCKKIVGIEYFEELHNIANEIKKNIVHNRLHYIKENIINVDINESTIIYFGIINVENSSPYVNDILISSVADKINKSKNIRIVISLCKLDIKYNRLIEKVCVPTFKNVIPGYPYPHFFYFIKPRQQVHANFPRS